MVPIRAKLDGDTVSVMVARAPLCVGDSILVRTSGGDCQHDGKDRFVEMKVTGVDEVGGEKRWHLKQPPLRSAEPEMTYETVGPSDATS